MASALAFKKVVDDGRASATVMNVVFVEIYVTYVIFNDLLRKGI